MFEKEAEEIANKRCHEIMCFGHCSFSSPKHHRCGEWHREYNCAKDGAEFGYNKANEWHKLDWKKDFPDVDKLVRVRTKSGEEYICQTYLYYPTEDEIGYGSAITQFEELNGDWVDDNEIGYWCYIEPFEESFMCKKVLYKWETDKRSYMDGFKDGYNKSNEWHYVKNGDLPKDDKQYLVLFFYNYRGKKEMSYGVRDNLHSDFEIKRCYTEQIIAWKEIVPPKECEK